MRVQGLFLMIVAVSLAGCAADGGRDGGVIDGGVDEGEVRLAAGKGAIEGLLVDDRFRPIDLEDDPQNEFQAEGFVLLQETGQQVQTDENGQFAVLDLEPGIYTIRARAAGHEATPQRVTVTEGQFAEVQVLARRIVNEASTIITQEYSVFIACGLDYIGNGGNYPCDGDMDAFLNDNGYQSFYMSNFSAIPDVSYVITDFLPNQESGYHIQIRDGGDRYATAIWAGTYVQIVLEVGETNQEWEEAELYSPNVVYENDREFQTIFFVEHQELRDLGLPLQCCGVGATLGIKGQFVQSVFIGEPEIDLAAYCVLC